MDTFIIQGGKKLKGAIEVEGAKNSAVAIIAATVLVAGETRLRNVPNIHDVVAMLKILESMGASVRWDDKHNVTIDTKNLNGQKIDQDQVAKLRASVMFLGGLASRFGGIRLNTPGGCQIGSRPLNAHVEALTDLGYEVRCDESYYEVNKSGPSKSTIVMHEFGVTPTENAILASVIGQTTVTIKCAAADYQVQDLCWFLNGCGAHIDGVGTHTLTIQGVPELHGTSHDIIPDPIEAGTLIVLAAATGSNITIVGAPLDFMEMEMSKFSDVGVNFEISNERLASACKYKIYDVRPVLKRKSLKAIKIIKDMPYPGFAPDLMQPFALLMTQAQGISLIHDWMYDGRLRYVSELQKMGANINILDPHRILIVGPTPLYAKEITSYDLRAGATLVIAALVAEGRSVIHNISQVDRGYERLDERLRSLGADIARE